MPDLIISNSIGETSVYGLVGDRTTIGRLPDNSIVLAEGTVSSHHAEILLSNGEYTLVDLNSANGTTVNGQAVGRCIIRNGDEIYFGGMQGRFKHNVISAKLKNESEEKGTELVESFTNTIDAFSQGVGQAANIARLQAVQKKLELLDLRSGDNDIGNKAFELKVHADQYANIYDEVSQLDVQIAECRQEKTVTSNATFGDKIYLAAKGANERVRLEAYLVKRKNLLTNLGKEIRTHGSSTPELNELIEAASLIQKRILSSGVEIHALKEKAHPVARVPWLVAVAALLPLTVLSLGYQSYFSAEAKMRRLAQNVETQAANVSSSVVAGVNAQIRHQKDEVTHIHEEQTRQKQQQAADIARKEAERLQASAEVSKRQRLAEGEREKAKKQAAELEAKTEKQLHKETQAQQDNAIVAAISSPTPKQVSEQHLLPAKIISGDDVSKLVIKLSAVLKKNYPNAALKVDVGSGLTELDLGNGHRFQCELSKMDPYRIFSEEQGDHNLISVCTLLNEKCLEYQGDRYMSTAGIQFQAPSTEMQIRDQFRSLVFYYYKEPENSPDDGSNAKDQAAGKPHLIGMGIKMSNILTAAYMSNIPYQYELLPQPEEGLTFGPSFSPTLQLVGPKENLRTVSILTKLGENNRTNAVFLKRQNDLTNVVDSALGDWCQKELQTAFLEPGMPYNGHIKVGEHILYTMQFQPVQERIRIVSSIVGFSER